MRIAGRNSSTVIIAPHGGGFEPGTSEIAAAIAGPDLLVADFAGIKSKGNKILHITGTRFEEPRCIALVEATDQVIAIHGEGSEQPVVYLGGLAKRGQALSQRKNREDLTNSSYNQK